MCRLLVEESNPNIGLRWQNLKKNPAFPPILLYHAILDQPTMDSGGVTRRRYVALAVCCWLLAGCTSMALQWHFNGNSTELQRHFNGTSRDFFGIFYIKKYPCFYPHRSRDSVSSVCTIFYYLDPPYQTFIHCGTVLKISGTT